MHAKGDFSADVYLKSQSELQSLKAMLPKESVGGIVEEILTRIQSKAKHTGYSVNAPAPEKVEKLAYALISEDQTEGARFIQDVREDGASLEAVYLSYLAQAAYLLGTWWEEDHVSFVEVTVGTSRIYAIIRGLSHLFSPSTPAVVRAAVFASVPGETHLLGVRMAADLFAKDGWDIDLKVGRTHEELVQDIVASDCTIVGLSAAGRHSAAPLAKLVMALRISKPEVAIILSGNITHEALDLLPLMDLEGMAHDMAEARDLLESTWSAAQDRRTGE